MRDQVFADAQARVLDRYGVSAAELWVSVPGLGGHAHVLIAGTGPPVVLLNGLGLPAAMLGPLMARLEGFTQYAIDLPGYGLSDVAPGFCEDLRDNAVRFLAGVLDTLGLTQPTPVIANSLGSLWASWLAIDRPERVAGLVHIGCPAVVLDTSAPLPMRLASVHVLGRVMMRLQPASERQVAQLATMMAEHPLPPEIAELVLATERLAHFKGAFLAMLNRLLRLRGNRPETALKAEELATISAPALLVFSLDDPIGGPTVGERVQEAMPHAELRVVPGGHAPWVHHAEQIAPAVQPFLRRNCSRQP